MNTILNKFYTGSFNKFGFGTWNSGERGLLKLGPKKDVPPPATQYRPINNYKPIPKTTSSMPNMLGSTYQPSVTIPNPGQFDMTNQTNGRNFSPEALKMHLLEEKIRQIEKETKQEKDNIRDILGMKQIPVQQPTVNPLAMSQPLNPKEARRQQIKLEIEQARKKLKNTDSSYDSENEESEEEGEVEEEEDDLLNEPMFKKRKNTIRTSTIVSNISTQKNVNNNLERRSTIGRRSTIKSNAGLINNLAATNANMNQTMISKKKSVISSKQAEEDANQFINNIPQHIALQLQSDNFKVRENLSMIKAGFREIRADLENKLEQIEMRQKINFENIRYVIERGGNSRLKASLRKYLDNENVDLDEIEEEVPKYIEELPDLIDRKIVEIDKRRREEDEQRRMEEEKMKEAERMSLPPIMGGMPNEMLSGSEGYMSDMQRPYEEERKEDVIEEEKKVQENKEEKKEEKKKKKKKDKDKKERSKSKKKDKERSKSKKKDKEKSKSKKKKKNKEEEEDDDDKKKKKRAKSSKKKKDKEEEESPKKKDRAKSSKSAKSKSKSKKKKKEDKQDEENTKSKKEKSKKKSKSKSKKKDNKEESKPKKKKSKKKNEE